MKKLIVFIAFLYAITSVFAQKETEVTLTTSDGKTLYGSLLLPKKKGKFNLVVIISGSGPTDRNGNNPLMQNNSLKFLAEELAKHKIASFRFDNRGVAKSQNAITSEEELRFDTYVNDVVEWVKLLKDNPHINHIYIAGHSEGSLIGMIAANRLIADSIPVYGFISIAGAGKPADEILKTQLSQNIKDSTLLQKCNMIIDSLKSDKTANNVPKELYTLFRPSVQPYMISWFTYNPQQELAKLNIPILILQGDADLQVTVNDAQQLYDSKSKIAHFYDKNKDEIIRLVIIDKMNHVMKIVNNEEENRNAYSNPELPVSKALIDEIVLFVKER